MIEKKDTSPMVRTRRIKRQIRIQEENIPPCSLFDTTVEYPSDALPEWFAPLQPVIEDETFTDMRINLGGKVFYHVSLVEDIERVHSAFRAAVASVMKQSIPAADNDQFVREDGSDE